jgi:hypothetical protein
MIVLYKNVISIFHTLWETPSLYSMREMFFWKLQQHELLPNAATAIAVRMAGVKSSLVGH